LERRPQCERFQSLSSATRYAALSNGEIKKTTDGGQGWSTVLAASGTARSIAINPNQQAAWIFHR
jgi:hypothetical protein